MASRKKAIVLGVENRKGGVGKTTTAVTLAVELARMLREDGRGKETVLVIDLDAQGHVSLALGIQANGRCISNVLTGDGSVDLLKQNVVSADRSKVGGPARPNLYVLPATDRWGSAKVQIIANYAVDAVKSMFGPTSSSNDGDKGDIVTLLDDKLWALKQTFTYIIVDCPPSLDAFQKSVHHFVDAAIVPVKLDYFGAFATGHHTQNVLDDQAGGINISVAAVVPTFADFRANLPEVMMDNLRNTYGRSVAQPIPNTIKVAESPEQGMTITEYMPESPAAKKYRDLARRIYKQGRYG